MPKPSYSVASEAIFDSVVEHSGYFWVVPEFRINVIETCSLRDYRIIFTLTQPSIAGDHFQTALKPSYSVAFAVIYERVVEYFGSCCQGVEMEFRAPDPVVTVAILYREVENCWSCFKVAS